MLGALTGTFMSIGMIAIGAFHMFLGIASIISGQTGIARVNEPIRRNQRQFAFWLITSLYCLVGLAFLIFGLMD